VSTILVARDEADREPEIAEKYLRDMVREDLAEGDYVFPGMWADDKGALIGVERKRVNADLARCVVQTHHHLAQLDRCKRKYDVVYLLIEGHIVRGPGGVLLEPGWRADATGRKRRGMWPIVPALTYDRLVKHLETIELRMGVKLRRTESFGETTHWLNAMSSYWERAPEKHTSVLEIPEPLSLYQLGTVHRIAAQLPGIGYEQAGRVGQVAKTPRELHDLIITRELAKRLTEVAKAERIPGKKLTRGMGPKTMEAIYRAWVGDVENGTGTAF